MKKPFLNAPSLKKYFSCLFAPLKKICSEQESRIKYLESLLSGKTMPQPSPSKEEIKSLPSLEKNVSMSEEIKKPSDLITRISISKTSKMVTFGYIQDSKNPIHIQDSKIFLIGELTKGKFIEMKPTLLESSRTVFTCKLMVEPGFKYTFCFKVGDQILTDPHYPVYRTKYGQNLNWVYVTESGKGFSKQALTFVDNALLAYERKKLESLYKKVMNAGELPLLKELQQKAGKLFYAVEEPYGIIKLNSVTLEGIFWVCFVKFYRGLRYY